jgi:hypothetical protein
MTDTAHKRRHIPFFLVKILVVLIFPLEMAIAPSFIGWVSLLLFGQSNHFPSFTSIPSLLIGLIIMLPCIYFERMLNSSPISRPVRKQVVVSCILSCGISMALLLSGLANAPSVIALDGFTGRAYVRAAVIYAPILGISFFVVLPLILRESALRTMSADHHRLSYQVINSVLQKRFKREKVLSGLLWFSLLFCPFLLILGFVGFSVQFFSLSVFFIMNFQAYSVFADITFFGGSLQLTGVPFVVLPLVILLSSIRFVFVRDVFRFQRGTIDRSRLASAAILGEILPSAIVTLLMLDTISPGYSVPLIFPAPILPIAGLALIKLSRTRHLKETLWPDYESRMWYEQGQEPYAKESANESIKVPLTYLLISQVRKLRNKET